MNVYSTRCYNSTEYCECLQYQMLQQYRIFGVLTVLDVTVVQNSLQLQYYKYSVLTVDVTVVQHILLQYYKYSENLLYQMLQQYKMLVTVLQILSTYSTRCYSRLFQLQYYTYSEFLQQMLQYIFISSTNILRAYSTRCYSSAEYSV